MLPDAMGKALLRAVQRHVEETGHRRIYSTTWPGTMLVGFTCENCETKPLYRVTVFWVNRSELPADSNVWRVFGAEGRENLLEWLTTIQEPNAWRFLLEE